MVPACIAARAVTLRPHGPPSPRSATVAAWRAPDRRRARLLGVLGGVLTLMVVLWAAGAPSLHLERGTGPLVAAATALGVVTVGARFVIDDHAARRGSRADDALDVVRARALSTVIGVGVGALVGGATVIATTAASFQGWGVHGLVAGAGLAATLAMVAASPRLAATIAAVHLGRAGLDLARLTLLAVAITGADLASLRSPDGPWATAAVVVAATAVAAAIGGAPGQLGIRELTTVALAAIVVGVAADHAALVVVLARVAEVPFAVLAWIGASAGRGESEHGPARQASADGIEAVLGEEVPEHGGGVVVPAHRSEEDAHGPRASGPVVATPVDDIELHGSA